MAKAYIRVPQCDGAPIAPRRVRVVVLDWAHDGNGNPVAHYRLSWTVLTRGGDYAAGAYETGRREQVGYRDKASQAALWRLSKLFPGTSWTIEGGRINGDRAAGRAEFVAVREG